MKLYYFNDQNCPVKVFYQFGLTGDPVILKPASGAFFELPIPEDHVPFIKKWNDSVMLSHCSLDTPGEVHISYGKPPWDW